MFTKVWYVTYRTKKWPMQEIIDCGDDKEKAEQIYSDLFKRPDMKEAELLERTYFKNIFGDDELRKTF